MLLSLSGCASIDTCNNGVGRSQRPIRQTACAANHPNRRYQSNTDETYCELEQRQLSAFRDLDAPLMDADTVLKRLNEGNLPIPNPEEVVQSIEASLRADVPTVGEDAIFWALLADFDNRIAAAAERRGWLRADRFRLGTMPSRDIHAETMLLPRSRACVVVINSYLMLFSHNLTKTLLDTVDVEFEDNQLAVTGLEPQEVRQRLVANPQIVVRFDENMFAFLGGRLPIRYDVSSAYEQLERIRTGMELFVLGHEYGHIIKKHKALGTTSMSLLGGRGPSGDALVMSRSWQQELEADCVGLRLMNDAVDDLPSSDPNHAAVASGWRGYAKLGALLFLDAYDALEDTRAILNEGKHGPIILDQSLVRTVVADLSAGNCSIRDAGAVDALKRYAMGFQQTSHPPALLRSWILSQQLQQILDAEPIGEQGGIQIGKSLLRNLGILKIYSDGYLLTQRDSILRMLRR